MGNGNCAVAGTILKRPTSAKATPQDAKANPKLRAQMVIR
jgi:hypothetical protein